MPQPERTPEYRLENGQYASYLGDSRQFTTSTVKLLLDTEARVLLKHGQAEVVDEAFSRMTGALRAGGHPQFAATLAVVEDRFSLEMLNLLINSSGSVHRFCDNLKAANVVSSA